MTDPNWRNRQWTAERVLLLRKLWLGNYKVEYIADQMHEGCSVQAVLRKVETLGLPPRYENPTKWTAEIEDLLRKRWGEGYSASKIAMEIKATFKVEFTRNAIVGKSHRMKLGASANNTKTKRPVGMKRLRRGQQTRGRAPLKPPASPLAAIPTAPLPEPAPAPDRASWVKFDDLTGCRWIYGDPQGDHGYCGCKTIPGKSWCEAHFKRVYVQLDVRRPKKQWDEETKSKIAELQELINS